MATATNLEPIMKNDDVKETRSLL